MKKILFIYLFLLSGCASIPSPAVTPNNNNSQWMLEKKQKWRIGNSNETIIVPKGFVTDFASIPKAARIILSPHGQYSRAAVIHDYLYWSQSCTREQSDNLFLIGMKETHVSNIQRSLIYWSVRRGGQKSWDQNTQARINRLPKVLNDQVKHIFTSQELKKTQEYAKNSGIKDPKFPKNPKYCSLGNNTDIPGKIDTSLEYTP